MGSAAVLAVYSAGYWRTQAAAEQFDAADAANRRPAPPAAPLPVAVPITAAPAAAAAVVVPTPAPRPTVVALPPPPAAVAPVEEVLAAVEPVAKSLPPAAENPPVAVAAANAAVEVAPKAADVPRPKWKDGKFSGWGSCRHGDIEATIEIKGGRIVSAVVSDCRTRYSCDVIDKIIPQVVARQSADVDTVSGATQSADAFYYAVTSALAAAKPDAVKAL